MKPERISLSKSRLAKIAKANKQISIFCGTEKGWRIHQRKKETPCKGCARARELADKERDKIAKRLAKIPKKNGGQVIKQIKAERRQLVVDARAAGIRLGHITRDNCSSNLGWLAHERWFEVQCDSSLAAHEVWLQEPKERVRTRKPIEGRRIEPGELRHLYEKKT